MILKKLVSFLAPYRWQVTLAILLSALTIGASISLMSTSALLISMAALHPSVAALSVAVVGVRFFGITRGLFRYAERLVSHSTSFKVLENMRVWLYKTIEPKAPAAITRYRLGDLLSRIMADVDTLENFFVRVFLPPVTALVVVGAVSLFMAAFSPMLGLILFSGLLLIGIGISAATLWLSNEPGVRLTDLRSTLREQMVDLAQGLPDILSFGRERDQIDRIEATATQFYVAQKQLGMVNALQTGTTSLLMSLIIFLLLVTAVPLVNSGTIEGIHLAVVLLAAMASFEAVQNLPPAMNLLGSNLRSAQRLFELEGVPSSITEPQTPLPIDGPPLLKMANLHFRHGDEVILQGIDLDLPLGKKVGIVGRSGAGKTTLAHLLLRFWDPTSGQILLNGQDIRSYNSDEVRKQITLVSQETYLFNTSIRENLRLARYNATDEQIEQACAIAGIADFIQTLPKKYETIIGERGMQVSGGERQRLAIARAVLKDAPIWILDEPTSSLDPATEKQIVKMLSGVIKEKTVLWISHRPAGLDLMDEVIFLDDGKVAEKGSYSSLAQPGSLFTAFWQSDLSGDE